MNGDRPKTTLADGAFDALMSAAVDAIIIIDENGSVLQFNPAAEQLFGYAEQDVVGRNVSLLMPEPHRSRHDSYLRRYRETGKAQIIGKGREEFGQRRNGDTFPMLLSVGKASRPEGDVFVGIIRDLSEVRATQEQVRQLEEQLLHADRLVILGELTAGIAHEINQPLTAIAAYADAGCKLMERHGADASGDLQRVCNRIGEQSRRAAEVVQRLRRLVRSGTVIKVRHDINQIIKNILLLFEFETKKTHTKLKFHPLEGLQELYVDEVQIQQIMVNLIKNSLDALTEAKRRGGTIEIRVERGDGELLVSVTDDGPGVPEESRARLFEPFFTSKPRGVGLGLSICKNIAAAHGGSLQYSEPPGGGSRFTLKLPLTYIG